MIPKVIHYCWFGGTPKSEQTKKCISSWMKFCPGYKLVEWNETNYKTDNAYFNQALAEKKWAFASDYARLDIIFHNGGIYFDTDVELIKPIDSLLNNGSFVGTEVGGEIATGLGFAAEVHNVMVKAMLDEYADIKFSLGDGKFDLTPCPIRNTKAFEKHGYKRTKDIEIIGGIRILPPEYLAPKNYLTRELNITTNTISIHHYDGAWMNRKSKIKLIIREMLGSKFNRLIYKIRGIDTD